LKLNEKYRSSNGAKKIYPQIHTDKCR